MVPKKYCSTKVRLGSFQEFVNIGILGYLKENYKSFEIPPIYKPTNTGEFIEKNPTKKSIVEYYSNKGINVFNPVQLTEIINKHNLKEIMAHFNLKRNILTNKNAVTK